MGKKFIGWIAVCLACVMVFMAAPPGLATDQEEAAFANFCKRGSVSEIKRLLASGMDVDAKNEVGYTALMLAAWSNPDPAVVMLLLEYGADVNYEDEDGGTALFYSASDNSDSRVTKALLDAGANPNVFLIGQDGTTLLMSAAGNNPNPEVTRLLLANGANVQAKDVEGKTPLMYAASSNPVVDVTEVLLKGGSNANFRDSGGKNAADLAKAYNENKEVAKLLASYSGSQASGKTDFSEYEWMNYRKAVFEDYPKGQKVKISGEVYDVDGKYASVFTERVSGMGYLKNPVIVQVPKGRIKALEGDRMVALGTYNGTKEVVDLFGGQSVIPVILAEHYESTESNFTHSIEDNFIDAVMSVWD
ncbi:ankyrin repeat domain-containing protein [Dethiosulfovibrio salsuginis]|uniref:Ankyrin repeat n=1 Tax=Dethiosulfovibrio salsuginis TaxID=561720 RepID=A0A1X7IMA0_9BACT|nr:ankyrin repeat domain-containing protein [Dethiosulfovibrio salsuginis]SMG16101.1 Ankyrin repeat [Dethiosulfovibrio salsuginis]